MNAKDARRINAAKKAKMKKTLLFTACALVVVAIVALIVVDAIREDPVRVFSGRPNQVVSLRDDGTFTAHLPHGVAMSGTFTEETENGITTITFAQGRRTEVGHIEGNVLIIPQTWDDGCGHGREFTLRS